MVKAHAPTKGLLSVVCAGPELRGTLRNRRNLSGQYCRCSLDRHVRKAAVQLLSIAAHNKADLVREQLPGLLPQLYQQTVIDQALIRTVDLGPFKHKIDDGLELRKAAFECMDVLLDRASARLYLPDFIRHLQSGIEAGASHLCHACPAADSPWDCHPPMCVET